MSRLTEKVKAMERDFAKRQGEGKVLDPTKVKGPKFGGDGDVVEWSNTAKALIARNKWSVMQARQFYPFISGRNSIGAYFERRRKRGHIRTVV